MREFKTECCDAYDTFWDDLHVCRMCHQPNPTMIEKKIPIKEKSK